MKKRNFALNYELNSNEAFKFLLLSSDCILFFLL